MYRLILMLLVFVFFGESQAQTWRGRADNAPDVGSPAPDFSLTKLKSSTQIKLSDYQGKKPVVLVFGSYT